MTGDRPLLPRDRALLVQLADGTLSGRRLARAEARARDIPGAERLIERQRRVTRALSAGAAPAPRPLAATGPLATAAPARRRAIAWRSPRLAGAGALAAVIALVAAVALHGGPSTVQRAADRAQLPATGPAPARSGPVLAADVDGVPFPAWDGEFGWRETGMRRDELDGRPTKTVYYEHMGHRIAYTIVSGPRLPRPEGARIVRRDGLEIAVYHDPRHGGHDIAVFERDGRTCVLAGHVMEQSTLLKLAAWRGGGSLRS
jgi:hypothetical protein